MFHFAAHTPRQQLSTCHCPYTRIHPPTTIVNKKLFFFPGFLAATSPPRPPPPPAFGGINGVRSATAPCTATAAAAASAPAATTSLPAAVSASVLSAREAVLELPPLEDSGAGESSYSVRWFEEQKPTVFDQVSIVIVAHDKLRAVFEASIVVVLIGHTGAKGKFQAKLVCIVYVYKWVKHRCLISLTPTLPLRYRVCAPSLYILRGESRPQRPFSPG